MSNYPIDTFTLKSSSFLFDPLKFSHNVLRRSKSSFDRPSNIYIIGFVHRWFLLNISRSWKLKNNGDHFMFLRQNILSRVRKSSKKLKKNYWSLNNTRTLGLSLSRSILKMMNKHSLFLLYLGIKLFFSFQWKYDWDCVNRYMFS